MWGGSILEPRHENWEASCGSGSCGQGCPTTSSWGRTGLEWCHLLVTAWKCVKIFYYTGEYFLKTSLAVQTPTEG